MDGWLRFGAALIAGLTLGPGPAAADDTADAIAVIQKFTQTTSRDEYQALCTEHAVVVDHVPPYVFRGPTACTDEWDAVIAWTARNQWVVTDFGTPAQPEFVDVSGDLVYAVFDVKAAGTRLGKAFEEPGKYAFVVRHDAKGWRIAAVAWSTLAITYAK